MYDDDAGPPSKNSATRASRWVAETQDDGTVTLQLDQDRNASADCDVVTAEQSTQTDLCVKREQKETGVQTDSASAAAARAFSNVAKDLPQIARPAKHFVK